MRESMSNLYISIKIKNDMKMIPFAVHSAKEAAELAGLTTRDLLEIQLATEECLTNIIKYAFDDDQDETIEIVFENNEHEFTITMFDKGKPFDPSLFPVYDQDKLVDDYDTSGLGNHLISHIMDECHFNLLGANGKETIMVKQHEVIKADDTSEKKTEIEIDRENFHYEVRQIKQKEAVAISELAYKSYHYSYPYENLYYPDKVRHLNESGALISFVAVSDDGKIIGHSALDTTDILEGVCEIGIAFTDLNYRGLGIFNRIWDVLFKESEKRGFSGLYANCVTTHPYSQKGAAKYGMKDVAFRMSLTQYIDFNKIDSKHQQRESFILAYKFNKYPSEMKLYLPKKHEEIIKKLLDQFDTKNDYLPLPAEIETKESIIKTSLKNIFNVSYIKVDSFGSNVIRNIENKLRALCVHRVETIYLYLSLNDPATSFYLEEIENLGFIFSGICPQENGEVALIMQYLNNQSYDFEPLVINSDIGRELVNYVKNEFERAYPEPTEEI